MNYVDLDRIKLVVKHSCIIVNNYELGECSNLEHSLSSFNLTTHQYIPIGYYYDEANRRLYLPRGIDIWYVEKNIGCTAYVHKYADPYNTTGKINLKLSPRDERQIEGLQFMLGLDKYASNRFRSQLYLSAPTGAGKTYMSIATIAYKQIKSIIITYANEWLEQWKQAIIKTTDLDNRDVYKIAGAPAINMLLSGKSNKVTAKIFLITHATLKSYGDTYGWEKVGELFAYLGIGYKFYDEAHLNFQNMCMIDFFTNTFRTYYITATPARSCASENQVYGLFMKNVPVLDMFDEEKDPHTAYLAMKFQSKPTPTQRSACMNMYGLNKPEYVRFLTSQAIFYKMLIIIMDMILSTEGNNKALFFINTNEAILTVVDWFKKMYPEYRYDVGIYTSITPKEEKVIAKQSKFIFSTIKSAGACVDIPGLKFVVQLADPFKSLVSTIQALGRTRAKDTVYIDCIDLAFKFTRDAYWKKQGTYKKYAMEVSEETYTSYDIQFKSENINMKRTEYLQRLPLQFDDGPIKPIGEVDPFKPIEPIEIRG